MDPLDDVLKPQAPATAPFREALRDRTTSVLRARRWRRRLALTAAACLLFAAGMGTMAWLGRANLPAPEEAAPLAKKEPPLAPVEPPAAEATDALTLEWQAFDKKAGHEKGQLLVKAGQKYLHEMNDIAGALRCYGAAVRHADRGSLRIDPEDDFLIMALKLERQKED